MAPKKTLYGGETQKAVDNFPISGETVPPSVIHWLGRIKGAAARANADLARSWATFAGAWPVRARRELLDAYARITAPTLLLWADRDPLHPLQAAEEALDLLPDAQLRVLSGTGFLIAYDDPVGVGRELAAFCG